MPSSIAVSKTNVRYITGSAKKSDGKTVAIKFRVFAENNEILKSVTSRLTKLKPTGEEGKLATNRFNGWDLKLNTYFKEYVTKNRAEFQDAFKAAKRAAIEAGRVVEAVKPEAKKDEKKGKAKK